MQMITHTFIFQCKAP